MPAEARITAVWRRQKFMVAALLIGMSGWFFFDGFFTWPFSNERWLKHREFETAKNLDGWPAYAESRNWSKTPPHKFFTAGDIQVQFVLGSMLAVFGTGMLAYWFRAKATVVRTDSQAVYAPCGKRIPFAAITSVNKKNWDTKGLATVHYQLEGRPGKFVLDDYKYSAVPMQRIMTEIEAAGKGRAK